MNRPYCVEELNDLDYDLLIKYRLSDVYAQHFPCMHKYRVKKGGRKEQFVAENGNLLNDSTCSVCFKLKTTLDALDLALIDRVSRAEDGEPTDRVKIAEKDAFYRWLYRHEYS